MAFSHVGDREVPHVNLTRRPMGRSLALRRREGAAKNGGLISESPAVRIEQIAGGVPPLRSKGRVRAGVRGEIELPGLGGSFEPRRRPALAQKLQELQALLRSINWRARFTPLARHQTNGHGQFAGYTTGSTRRHRPNPSW